MFSLAQDRFEWNKENPYEGDLLRRKDFVVALAGAACQVATPTVIGVSGDWGCGKTTISRLLEWELNKIASAKVVRIDIWRESAADDPLLSLLRNMIEAVRFACNDGASKISKVEEAADNLNKLASKLASPVSSFLLRKSAEAYGVSSDDSLSVDIASATAELALDTLVASKSSSRKGVIDQFRRQLEVLADIAATDQELDALERPASIVVIVDELDRAPPSVSLSLLERIQHLFSVPGICFVLFYEPIALGSAVKAIHGPTIDGIAYLRRFISFEVCVPTGAELIARARLHELGLRDQQTVDLASGIASNLGYSAREIERWINFIRLLSQANLEFWPARYLVIILTAVWVRRPEIVRDFCSGRSITDLRDRFPDQLLADRVCADFIRGAALFDPYDRETPLPEDDSIAARIVRVVRERGGVSFPDHCRDVMALGSQLGRFLSR